MSKLTIQVFGPVRVIAGGEDVALPASRKTRALLAYLAMTGRLHRRERLCDLLWDLPDDPRGALRWSLSKLRSVFDRDDVTRIVADRERVQFDIEGVDIDFLKMRDIANGNEARPEDLIEAWEMTESELLEDCELPNQPGFSAWLSQQRNEVIRLRVRLARRLAVCPDLPPEASERWADRWLQDAPFDPIAAAYAVDARRGLGREREADALAEDLHQAFEAQGLDAPSFSSPSESSIAPIANTASTDTPDGVLVPTQSIRFAKTEDNALLAWASVGSESNPPLVKAANWLSHLELDWEAPIWSPLFRQLATTFNFVRYDERGCGLSDWDVPDISFETFVSDLERIVDAAGLEKFPLLGISQGAAVSIEYAARHPDKVSHLILFGGYTAGWRHTATPEEAKEREAMMVLTETGWGRQNPAYRHVFSRTFMPDATAEELAWFDEFQKNTTSPENAVRFLEAFSLLDVRDRLKDVQAPTLVIHCRGDMRIPIASGKQIAAELPNAEFLTLESNNHLLLGREPASKIFIEEIERFLKA
ncbi:alpha/beta fold hydrolase [Henriciella sp. AS95]|uniref:alpha/beta fold hydrolase n=1 Tax=Henriciella sp. AS95 TaxID=3135782 RepID=UPI003175C1FD